MFSYTQYRCVPSDAPDTERFHCQHDLMAFDKLYMYEK